MRRSAIVVAVSLAVLLARTERAAAADAAESATTTAYKGGESWPHRNFNGLDFAEPFVPLEAAGRGDWGRIALGSALPFGLLAASFAFERTDARTLEEIGRWRWVGIDEAYDDNPTLFALVGVTAITALLPSPEDQGGYSWSLRLDRATVLGLGFGATSLGTDVLKKLIRRHRPDDGARTSRPSGHASAAFAAAAFASDVLRDALRPQSAETLGLRILEEAASAAPYLGAGYIALERVHARRHFLTDTLLGGALGVFTMHALYAWSFAREEEGRGWLASFALVAEPLPGGVLVALGRRF